MATSGLAELQSQGTVMEMCGQLLTLEDSRLSGSCCLNPPHLPTGLPVFA